MTSYVTLKRRSKDDWNNLALVIDNAHMEDDGTIVESCATLIAQLDGRTAFDILIQLHVAKHSSNLCNEVMPISINHRIYKMDTEYWHPLYNILVSWNECRNAAEEVNRGE